MIRLGLPRERHELHVLATRRFDAPAAEQAPRIGEQHDLEQDLGMVGPSTQVVVAVVRVERREIDLAFQQVMQRVLEGSRQDLLGEADRDEGVLLQMGRLVSRHSCSVAP